MRIVRIASETSIVLGLATLVLATARMATAGMAPTVDRDGPAITPAQPAEAEAHNVTIIRKRPVSDRPRHLEVRTGSEVAYGLEYARVANWLLLLGRDGQLRRFDVSHSATVVPTVKPFEPASQRELEITFKREFGSKFKTKRTPHYVICHNTTDAFADETADLLEDLYRAFTSHFAARGMGLSRPQFPMVVIVFGDEAEFRRYMAESPGAPELKQISGYYSIDTNRVAFFHAARDSEKYGDARWHNLTTVIHEATHQIAFNSGCHRRFADTPLWLAEGLAMYFEAPEFEGKKLIWSQAGRLNTPRLERFAALRKKGRAADSLKSLVSSDVRFRADGSAADAYAESWALTYFLVNQRAGQFYKYVKQMIGKPALAQDSPEQRLEEFQAAFGRDLRFLDQTFLRFVDELPRKK